MGKKQSMRGSMLMGSKQKLQTRVNSEKCLNLEVRGYKIEQVTSQKLLPENIQFSGPTIWNNLPPDARSAKFL